jgi:hypothetical protein
MENFKKIFNSLIFNIAETILIFLVGKLLNLPANYIIIIMLCFMISRGFFGKALHFKTWYRCLIWSCLILLSLFLILKVDLVISILFTIFSAFIMTGKSNINDMYLWKNTSEPSKYADIEEYVKYNEFNTSLIEFEENLKRRDNLLFLIYKYRFKDKLTFKEISDKLEGMENPRIVEKLNQIALAIRIHCGI